MTSEGNDGQIPDAPEDSGRRDFGRSALAASAALLVGPQLLAAPQKTVAPAIGMTNDVYTTGGIIQTKCVYLYRVLPTGVLAYFIERQNNIPYSSMETQIEYILNEINAGWIRPAGFGLGDIRWRKRSYFAVVMEDARYPLARGNAVTFAYQGGGGNHTFRSGKDIPASGDVTRFFCVNHMQKQGGGDVGAAGEAFKVTLNHPNAAVVLAHYDTGTNTGPPL